MTGNVNQKPILAAFGNRTPRHVPFWFMRQAGRYLPEYRELRRKSTGFLDFCFTPELAVEATLQPLRRFGMDAAILFSDILVVPHVLGQKVAFREGEGPVLEPIRDRGGIDALNPDGALERLEPVFAALRGISTELDDATALIGFAGAPWTVATYMVEGRGGTRFETIRGWAKADPETFGRLIDRLVDTTARYLIEQLRNGAELLQLFDTWAGVLDEDEFNRWTVAPTARIVQRVKAAFPDVPILGFPRHCRSRIERFVAQTGVDGVSLDSSIDPAEIPALVHADTLVQGNLDPRVLVGGGEALRKATREILAALADRRFIFNLGHGIVPETPPEHVAEVARMVREWKRDDKGRTPK